VALGIVSFFTDVSTEMCLSILPWFLIWELRATRAILGLVEGLAEGVSYVLRMVSGVISDRLGRRKLLILMGYGLSNLVKPFLSIAQTWGEALAIRVGDRVGKGIRTAPRDALLSESIPSMHVGKAFGIHRSLDQLGAIVGPLLAFTLFAYVGSRGIFWLSFIPGLAALITLVFLVEERAGRRRGMGRLLGDVRRVLHRRFLLLMLVLALFSIGAFNYSFILLKAGELGVSEPLIPLVYAAINVAHTIMGVPAGVLSDRIGGKQTLILGYSFFAATAILCMTLPSQPIYAFLIAITYGTYMGIAETVQRALISRYAPEGLRATAYGIYYLTVGGCLFTANLMVGSLWEFVGGNAAFLYSTFTSILSILGMAILTAYER